MSEAQSPNEMEKIVKFMIGLALLGTIIAVAAYFMVALPAQTSAGIAAPNNWCHLDPTGRIWIC
jgi:hypothetical protein